MSKQRIVSGGLTFLLCAGLALGAASRASASTSGRRNTTIALGAATAGAFATKNKKAGIILGIGTLAAGYRWYESARDDKRKQQKARNSTRVASYRSSNSSSSGRYGSRSSSSSSRRSQSTRLVSAAKPSAKPCPDPNPAAIITVNNTIPGAAVNPQLASAPAPEPASRGGSSLPITALMLGGGALAGGAGYGIWQMLRRRLSA